MSPYNSPTHTPPDWDPGVVDDGDYLAEGEPFEIVEAPSDQGSSYLIARFTHYALSCITFLSCCIGQ